MGRVEPSQNPLSCGDLSTAHHRSCSLKSGFCGGRLFQFLSVDPNMVFRLRTSAAACSMLIGCMMDASERVPGWRIEKIYFYINELGGRSFARVCGLGTGPSELGQRGIRRNGCQDNFGINTENFTHTAMGLWIVSRAPSFHTASIQRPPYGCGDPGRGHGSVPKVILRRGTCPRVNPFSQGSPWP